VTCYKILTLVVDENNNFVVLLGKRYDEVFVVNEGDYFRLVFAKKKKYIKVKDILDKECITPKEFRQFAKEIMEKVAEVMRDAE